ncbi:hypothetical protein [Vibrio hannami]|uniref:hypothetical protein n=1 Tax=Vibrio hannami TaxID=2717094 RepID=UPI003EC006FD
MIPHLAKLLTRFGVLIFCLICSLQSQSVKAVDIIRFESGQYDSDQRLRYKKEVLTLAMERTKDTYGPYEIRTNAPRMNSLRAIQELETGELINVFIALTNEDWEKRTIPIRIPVRRGILNYRLLLIHKDSLPYFTNIETVDELKALNVGLRRSWMTWRVLNHLGFTIVSSSHYDSLISMLQHQRFHYIPRGINEIYDELNRHKTTRSNLMVAPNIALYIPAPAYIFVSHNEPRLAKRLSLGMTELVEDGSLEQLFNEYYGDLIKRANLQQRVIIDVGNHLLPDTVPLNESKLWWNPGLIEMR